MIGLLQRVSEGRVIVADVTVARIDRGLLVLIGVERGDTEVEAEHLLERILGYRVFPDAAGKMNLSLRDIAGGLLMVPQFTLSADTRNGRRPSFSTAAPPELGRTLFTHLIERARSEFPEVAAGVFGADMQVALINDGPVTFWLRSPPGKHQDP
ncbi:MAG: D-aminoacyl-tRNA deacylase [Thiotrichales bacterium]